jgi:hypothetical protein
MFGRRLSRALVLTTVGALLLASLALADTVVISNDIAVNTNVTKAPGTTGTGYVTLAVTNGTPAGDTSGCNATGAEPLTVNLASSNADVTLDSASVQLTGCGVAASFGYTVESDASGTATISASSWSGGRTDGTRLYLTTDTLVITISAPSDTTNPVITGISINDGASWTNSTAVSVDISATDNVGIVRYRLAESQADLATASDVAVNPAEASFSRSDLAFTLTGLDAASKAVWLRVYDAAGNSADSSDDIGLDRVRPTSVVDGFADGAIFYLGDTLPTPSCDSDDDLSGVFSGGALSGPTGTGLSNVNGVGSFIYSCNGAVDNAGNVQTSGDTKTFFVWYAGVSGILQPINPDNTSLFSRGKAVPVKFQLAGDEPNGFDFSAWQLKQVSVSCTNFDSEEAAVDPVVANPSNAFRYDSTADQYIYNANFKDKAVGSCWKVQVWLDSGQILNSAVFKLQK